MDIYLLQHLLLHSSMRFPDRTAVSFGRRSLTYACLNDESDRLAEILADNGVGNGDRVGLLLDKSIEAIISILGILKSGACYVPIDPLSPRKRTEYIIKNCKMRFVVTSSVYAGEPNWGEEAEGFIGKCFVWGNNVNSQQEKGVRCESIYIEDMICELKRVNRNSGTIDLDPAYILHTSGSTGIPKGVVISHRNALAFVNMATEFFDINYDDNFCSQAPFHFDLSIFDIFVAIKSGAAITLAPGHLAMFPVQFAEFIDKESITILNSVSSVIASLAGRGRLERFKFESLRHVLFSGEVMTIKYLKIAMQYMANAKFFNIYGQTEANSSTCYLVDKIPREMNWVVPIGKSFPNFDVFALDESRKPISCPGEVGELYVKSCSVAMGYLGDKQATSEAFVDDPRDMISNMPVYRTGDLVKIDEDGNFVFLGRKDHQIKTRGYRVNLNEIECVLNNHFAVKDAVVIGVPDELMGNRIIAFLSIRDGNSSNCENQIIRYCAESLPDYMVPEKLAFCEKMPKTTSGKIDRKYLRDTWQDPVGGRS